MAAVSGLFDPERHESLTERTWDPVWARDTIARVVADTEAAFCPDGDAFWPAHPLDIDDEPAPHGYHCLHLGAAGVIWGLEYLSRAGAVSLTRAYREFLPAIRDAYAVHPDTSTVAPSYVFGLGGIALVERQLSGDPGRDDQLYALVRDNIRDPTLELCWGASGTMMIAEALYLWTGEQRFCDLFLDNVAHLLSVWHHEPAHGCRLWTQYIYGHRVQHIGAAHGFAGNVQAMLRRAAWLSNESRPTLYRECARTIAATVRQAGELANWPETVGESRSERIAMRVQWCHGAPGIITSFGHYPPGVDERVDTLLVRGGELTWRAGPLSKGFGLCHGTAGNGYAFLRLHQRTRDPIWLERARAFAAHAIVQMDAMRDHFATGRYSLWTGDIGLAVYLWSCLAADPAFPTLDVW